jgi:3-oxoacyl-[acyl-carrier protein] reductase
MAQTQGGWLNRAGALLRGRGGQREERPQRALEGRRVLVSGSSGSIGSAIAERLAGEGARIVLHYHRSSAVAEALAARINAAGGLQRAFAIPGRLDGQAEAGRVFTQACTLLGGVDVLVNCVGLSRDDSIIMLSEGDADTVMRGNLGPVVYLCEAMRRQDVHVEAGRIVNITSITGLVGQPMRSLYGAAKGGVIAYTKSLAREIAARGWTANCIAPQVVEGGLAERMKPAAQAMISGVTPMRRTCLPGDLAGAALFLASADSGFVTGTVMNVTGGLVTW